MSIIKYCICHKVHHQGLNRTIILTFFCRILESNPNPNPSLYCSISHMKNVCSHMGRRTSLTLLCNPTYLSVYSFFVAFLDS